MCPLTLPVPHLTVMANKQHLKVCARHQGSVGFSKRNTRAMKYEGNICNSVECVASQDATELIYRHGSKAMDGGWGP